VLYLQSSFSNSPKTLGDSECSCSDSFRYKFCIFVLRKYFLIPLTGGRFAVSHCRMTDTLEGDFQGECAHCEMTYISEDRYVYCPVCGNPLTFLSPQAVVGQGEINTMRNLKLNSEQFDVLEYLARLDGKSTDQLGAEIVEEWLAESYAIIARRSEAELGLPNSVLVQRGKLRKDSRTVMESNLKTLRASA
jgi:hypothetical protein